MMSAPVPILLVDDLDENLLALEALLRREGLQLLKARSGVEALEILLKQEVALALLDVQMPEMDGFELAETLRGAERTRRIPIIFLTAGTAGRERRFRGYEAGAVDFLQKPIEGDILKSKVEIFVELYEQRRQIAQQRDALQAQTDEIQRTSEALREADHRKDVFLATLAHELRNPMAPIRNGLQILRMAPDSPMAGNVRDMMDRQMTHLVRLVDDLLDVSRVSQGKIELKREHLTLRSVVEAAVETARPVIDQAGHSFALDLPDEELWVDGDLTRLAQIVANLLNNAAKYTPEDGRIGLSLRRDGGQAVLRVSDTGLGIDADMLPRVFELFTQVDRNIHRAQGGLGIGLALAQKLVSLHGGSIHAESEGQNRGSTFELRLPLAPAPQGADNPAGTMQAAKTLNVLVVDDNRESAETTSWMLDLIGHRTRTVHDGVAALDAAANETPDVILLDIGMPGMNGYDVCRELRKRPELHDTVVIAQTGWGQDSDRQAAFDAGFNHHLTKPVNLDSLSRLLAEIQA
ncbi:response regulator [Asticcacaulis sp. AND118]|uniref:response regulator n=1 Tax=Asticcacaulis sp. AND118 TaxID=2840468 RepID=UPI001CFF6823|nr:response regulator [Asticcacaulis sp. AND118]UDF04108.1 response regulator [Asticcacaulis sp. AND118]